MKFVENNKLEKLPQVGFLTNTKKVLKLHEYKQLFFAQYLPEMDYIYLHTYIHIYLQANTSTTVT